MDYNWKNKELQKAFELMRINPALAEASFESYAYQQYRKAISDLETYSHTADLPYADAIVIIIKKSDYEYWKASSMSFFKMNVVIP